MEGPIIFICSGNTCRSPMAEVLLKAWLEQEGQKTEVYSRGLSAFMGDDASWEAIRAVEAIGLNLESHRSQRANPQELSAAGCIITMTDFHKRKILDIMPELAGKVLSAQEIGGADIADPYGGNKKTYRKCLEAIAACLDKLWPGINQFVIRKRRVNDEELF